MDPTILLQIPHPRTGPYWTLAAVATPILGLLVVVVGLIVSDWWRKRRRRTR